MASSRHAPKFRRETPQVRRESLIEATLQCLREFGHDGVSVRRISARAGVSVGLISHHFPGKASLVAAAYESLATALLTSIRQYALAGAGGPRERLHRFFEASFAPDKIDPQLFHVWLVFWSMVAHSEEMSRVHERTNGEYRAVVESLLTELRGADSTPSFDVRLAAIGLSSLLDGFWIESSLRTQAFDANEAIAICDDWISALAAGAFPRMREL